MQQTKKTSWSNIGTAVVFAAAGFLGGLFIPDPPVEPEVITITQPAPPPVVTTIEVPVETVKFVERSAKPQPTDCVVMRWTN